jgi:homoserine O-acetyltransferase
VNPQTGKPYALDFPLITIRDIVRAQKVLIDHLGIRKLHGVIGGSMGGMLALQWVASYPDAVECVIPVAATLKHSPQQIAFNEVGRQAIMADPAWNSGNYYGAALPEKGLAVARMVGHITYMSNDSMEKKFSRRLKDDSESFKFSADFEVEGYLQHRGQAFVKRFDANSYLYLTKAMDYFDLSDGKWIPEQGLPDVRFLVIAFKSDWLYPSVQSQDMVRQLKMRHIDATYCEIDASYGHDSFLIESQADKQAHLIKHFLAKRK